MPNLTQAEQCVPLPVCPTSHKQSSACPFPCAQSHTGRAVRAPSRGPNLTQAEQCKPLPVWPPRDQMDSKHKAACSKRRQESVWGPRYPESTASCAFVCRNSMRHGILANPCLNSMAPCTILCPSSMAFFAVHCPMSTAFYAIPCRNSIKTSIHTHANKDTQTYVPTPHPPPLPDSIWQGGLQVPLLYTSAPCGRTLPEYYHLSVTLKRFTIPPQTPPPLPYPQGRTPALLTPCTRQMRLTCA